MKTQNVNLSGMVYVKDPRDIETIRRLKEENAALKRDFSHIKNELIKRGPIENEMERLKEAKKKYERIETKILTAYKEIKKIQNMKVSVLMGWGGFTNSYLSKKLNERSKKYSNKNKNKKKTKKT